MKVERKHIRKEECEVDLHKSWKAKDWENYLSMFEVGRAESLLDDPDEMSKLTEEYLQEKYLDEMVQGFNPNLKALLLRAVEELTPQQQSLIRKLYWENKTVSSTARELNISRQSAERLRNRACTQLIKIMTRAAERLSSTQREFKESA